MSRKFLTPIDLSGLEILNARFQNLATAPTPKGKGHVYYNTVDDTVYVYDGSAWQASGKIIAGTLSSRPAAGSSGRLYFATDATEKVLYYDNGTAWTKVGESKKYIDDTVAGAINDHNVSSGVHGVTGNIVGDSDTQTLSNKTISDNLHFNDGSAGGYIAGNMGNLEIIGNNNIDITADDDLQLRTNNGNIVLSPDGNAYIGNAGSSNNRIATIGDLAAEGVNAVYGTAHEVDASTDQNGNVTVSLPDTVDIPQALNIGEDFSGQTFNNGTLHVRKADGSNAFTVDASQSDTTVNGELHIQDGNGNPKLSVTHSYTGTTRITTGDDLALRSTDGDIILYPGNDNGGPGRAYVHWGNDATGSNPQNEITTAGNTQTFTNKTVSGPLDFVNPSTSPVDGTIYVDDNTEEFVIHSNTSNLNLSTSNGNINLNPTGGNLNVGETFKVDVNNNYAEVHGSLELRDTAGTHYGSLSGDNDHNVTLYGNSNVILYAETGNAYMQSVDPANRLIKYSEIEALSSGLNWKQAVNLLYNDPTPTLSGDTDTSPLVIDGHPALGLADVGYRILIAQGNDAGIYVYNQTGTAWTLDRAADGDVYTELVGAAVFVMEGTTYGATSWVQSNHYITNFTNQAWVQFSGQGTYTAGDGIAIDGQEISVKLDSDSLSKSVNGLKVNLAQGGGLDNDGGLYVMTGPGISTNGLGQITIDTSVVARKSSAYVGNGAATSFVITHNLGTRDVTVAVYDAATYAEVTTDVARSTADTVTVSFAEAPTTDQYRVVIVG